MNVFECCILVVIVVWCCNVGISDFNLEVVGKVMNFKFGIGNLIVDVFFFFDLVEDGFVDFVSGEKLVGGVKY